jgi:transcriptional regulator with XRE-family HTH domain
MEKDRGFFKTVGAKVRHARDSARLTAAQLGSSLRPPVGHAAVTRWETGERRIPLDRLEQIAAITGHAVDYFLKLGADDAESDLDRELLAAFDAMRYASADDKRRLIEIMRALRRVELGR